LVDVVVGWRQPLPARGCPVYTDGRQWWVVTPRGRMPCWPARRATDPPGAWVTDAGRVLVPDPRRSGRFVDDEQEG